MHAKRMAALVGVVLALAVKADVGLGTADNEDSGRRPL